MQKSKLLVLSFTLAAALVSGAAMAIDIEKAIKARQGLMQIYAFNLGILGSMAKGATEYDAVTADTAANNLLTLASMKNGAMWPEGSSNDSIEFSDMTRALPEIWTTYPEVGNRGTDMISTLKEFTGQAGKDLVSLQEGMKLVGKACKGCHEDFRAEKE